LIMHGKTMPLNGPTVVALTVGRCRRYGAMAQSDVVVGLPDDVDGLFRTFMDNSPLTAWIVDEEDSLVYSSEPFPLRDDQVGTSMWELVPEPYVQPYRAALELARSTGETQAVTAPGPRADGTAGRAGWFQAF
jgi:hypothetical protein